VTFEGEHHRVTAHTLTPARRPPLLVGGDGRQVLRTAARFADIVGFTGFRVVEGTTDVEAPHFTRAGLADRIAVVREAAGDRFAELELNVLVQRVHLGPTPRAAAEELAEGIPFLDADGVLDSPFVLAGTPGSIADELRSLRDELGVSYVVTHGTDRGAMTPVVGLLAGA
jgi:alkanesulfonate monooxygenase SsuD/methylene tetrahydromethanopterin reductase-like flavin-dependent oxidoreductase (luciferase family)